MKENRISLFCLIAELQQWIIEICNKHNLKILVFKTYEDGEYATAQDLSLKANYARVFLIPENYNIEDLSFNKTNAIENGLVDITIGGQIEHNGEKIITMSEIYVNKFDNDVQATWKAIAELKRMIKKSAKNNVIGINTKNGGKSAYKDIWYTQEAQKLLGIGAKWKQKPEFNAVFEPNV